MALRIGTRAGAQQRYVLFVLLVAAQGCSDAREPAARKPDAGETDGPDAASAPRDQIELEELPNGAELDPKLPSFGTRRPFSLRRCTLLLFASLLDRRIV